MRATTAALEAYIGLIELYPPADAGTYLVVFVRAVFAAFMHARHLRSQPHLGTLLPLGLTQPAWYFDARTRPLMPTTGGILADTAPYRPNPEPRAAY